MSIHILTSNNNAIAMTLVTMSILEYHFGNTNGVLCLLSKKKNSIKYMIMRHISDDDFMGHDEFEVLRVGCCTVKLVLLQSLSFLVS